MKNTEEQDALKRRARADYETWQEAQNDKARAVIEFERKYDETVEPLRLRFLSDVTAMRDAEIPVTQIARDVLGHKGTVAAYRAIEEAERLLGRLDAANESEQAASVTRNADGTFTYTPPAEDLAPVLAKLGLKPEDAPTSAVFEVSDEGVVDPVTPRMGAEGMHPVVALVMTGDKKHADALRSAA
jgi:hypothetical protein